MQPSHRITLPARLRAPAAYRSPDVTCTSTLGLPDHATKSKNPTHVALVKEARDRYTRLLSPYRYGDALPTGTSFSFFDKT